MRRASVSTPPTSARSPWRLLSCPRLSSEQIRTSWTTCKVSLTGERQPQQTCGDHPGERPSHRCWAWQAALLPRRCHTQGSELPCQGLKKQCAIFKEEIVDTNGAGDAFVGGFLAQQVCCFYLVSAFLLCIRCWERILRQWWSVATGQPLTASRFGSFLASSSNSHVIDV